MSKIWKIARYSNTQEIPVNAPNGQASTATLTEPSQPIQVAPALAHTALCSCLKWLDKIGQACDAGQWSQARDMLASYREILRCSRCADTVTQLDARLGLPR